MDLDRNNGGVTVLPPYERSDNSEWYTGTRTLFIRILDIWNSITNMF